MDAEQKYNAGNMLKDSPYWAKVDKKHYIHVAGVDVKYNWDIRRWLVSGGGRVVHAYTTLLRAALEADRMANRAVRCTVKRCKN